MWFDRGLDFGQGSLVASQHGNLPRIVTSRSQDSQSTDSRLMSKREVKIAAVEWAISAMLAVYRLVLVDCHGPHSSSLYVSL